MVDWFYEFWRWLGEMVGSGKIWKPYESMGFWFTIIVVAFIVAYAFFTFRMWNWPMLIRKKLDRK